jgi:PAS domain S-box-containing protein
MVHPGREIVGYYDYRLVALSIIIAILASYTALDLAIHVTAARGRNRLVWLTCGSAGMGLGIWSMHYVGMLAFRLPIPVTYHLPTVLLSFLMGILWSWFALLVVTRRQVQLRRLLISSAFQGGGIAVLHYTAMASMRLQAICHYSPWIVTLSVIIAIASASLSLWLAFVFREGRHGRKLKKAASALSMGAAISAMHYTGMAAVRYQWSTTPPDLALTVNISVLGITGIAAVSVMVMIASAVTGLVDKLQKQSALLDELFEQMPQAVALLNRQGRVVRINREFVRLFGYSMQESTGRLLSELIVPPESQQEVQERVGLMAAGQRVEAEVIRQRKDGSRVHALAIGVPLNVPDEEIAIYSVDLDITARKEAESALQTLSLRLLAVQETERRHLARELHDEIGQLLTGLRLLLKPNGDWPADAVKTRFDQARAIVDELLAKVRRLSFDLRPADLDQLGLLPALLAFFERFSEQTGVLVDFKHKDIDGRFAPAVETSAYRIVQEALTNVARHAGVAGAMVRVWTNANVLNLHIEDRGRGFDVTAALKDSRTSGLRGMRERAMLLGGSMTIESDASSGTALTVELPLSGRENDIET